MPVAQKFVRAWKGITRANLNGLNKRCASLLAYQAKHPDADPPLMTGDDLATITAAKAFAVNALAQLKPK